MNDPENKTPNDLNVKLLISQWYDERLDAAGLRELQSCLRSSESARLMFLSYSEIQSSLLVEGQAEAELNQILASDDVAPLLFHDSPPPVVPRQNDAWGSRYQRAAVVAAIAASLLLGLFVSSLRPPAAVEPAAVAVVAAPIGRVVGLEDNCLWSYDDPDLDESVAASGEILGGSTLRVTRGNLRAELSNGVLVTILGPALVEAESDMQMRLLSGRIRATVVPGAEGFRVDVPQATVVDLGTEFGVEVGTTGETKVVVFDGEVNIDLLATKSRPALSQSLVQGQAMRLDEHKNPMRLASVWSDDFNSISNRMYDQLRERLILKVDDNLDRVWNYYEIVHQGMREDARAFVGYERDFEWNGLTARGIPEYLLGGDYVRTFKGDDIVPELELQVTLAAPSKLYILFDERRPTPEWLLRDFRRTYDRIGLDMGPWVDHTGLTGEKFQYAEGAGNSIDRVATIWESKEVRSGLVTLGSTESLQLGTLMYGIVAQPAEEAQERLLVR